MYKNLLKIVCSAMMLTSCVTSDFIDLLPPSSVTVDIIYKTDKDFVDALTATYRPIQQQYEDFYIFGDIRGDDSWESVYKNNDQSYSDLFTTSSSDGLMNNTWQRYYRAIFRANTLLSKIEEVSESDVPKKNRYIAETRFLRALCYFDLVRIFGAVPALTEPVSVIESYKIPREPVENIYNNIIIPDFLAAESLPGSYTGSDIGRPTSGAAKSMLGRVYLTIKDFQKAESKLREVTSMNYNLLPNYNDLFVWNNKRHSEYIFDIEYEAGVGMGSSYAARFLPNFLEMTLFYGITGAGDEKNNPTPGLIALFDDHDKRKLVTVGRVGGYYNAAGEWRVIPSLTSQYYTLKFVAPTPSRWDSPVNWKVIRYGDVVLMLAEALNENGKTAEAIPWLNQIRNRAGVDEYPATLSQAEARDAIAKERRLELSFEGVRWFDLVRTGKAYEACKDVGMREYMTVFPIPLTQIQLINDPAILSQNPGYN